MIKESILRMGTLKCPDDGTPFHWHVWGTMRLRTKDKTGKDKYHAYCPVCKKEWAVAAPKEK